MLNAQHHLAYRCQWRWDQQMSAVCAQFVRSAADARIPRQWQGAGAVQCRELSVEAGWLSDADIKAPRHKPAPFAEYAGDRSLAFWHLDRAMAEMIDAYHAGPWEVPDPTAGQEIGLRFYPPAMLRDTIDARPEPVGPDH